MTSVGVYDLLGNVREWCYNEAGDGRATRGGAWTDAPFHVGWIIPKSPFDRHETHGIRLVRTFDDDSLLARLRGPVNPRNQRDYRTETPASETEYEIYRRLYAYDPAPLNSVVERADTFKLWVREKVTFDLPYGERGGAYLYLPRERARPLQPVVYWGGSPILATNSIDDQYMRGFDFLMRSGRAVALPMFKGAYERDDSEFSLTYGSLNKEGSTYRDYNIQWVKDLSRTIDYLETRADIDAEKIAYIGFSWGGLEAPIVLTVEPRIKLAVLNVGGLWPRYRFLPEIDPINFVTRVRKPVLMINGEYDIVFPLETAQKPMFELLGTDPAHKKHYITKGGHVVPLDELIRETLDWLDRYLGPVE